MRLVTALAGVRGRAWLYLDGQLAGERVVVRLGGLMGELLHLLQVGLGQGRRSGVQLFGALTRGLLDEVEARYRAPVAVMPADVLAALRATTAWRPTHRSSLMTQPSTPWRNGGGEKGGRRKSGWRR